MQFSNYTIYVADAYIQFTESYLLDPMYLVLSFRSLYWVLNIVYNIEYREYKEYIEYRENIESI